MYTHHLRAADNRCAVDLAALDLPISAQEAIDILKKVGFTELHVDLLEEARQLIGVAHYRRGASFAEAPAIVDCSLLTKWVYGRIGFWLPRRSIQQREVGVTVTIADRRPGDLVFTTGWKNYYRDDPDDGVGHVGIATDEGTIVHAANRNVHVVEVPLVEFLHNKELRGVRRYLPPDRTIRTFQIPPHREVESSDDIRWIILQNLPR